MSCIYLSAAARMSFPIMVILNRKHRNVIDDDNCISKINTVSYKICICISSIKNILYKLVKEISSR